jgi:hypothetical protein
MAASSHARFYSTEELLVLADRIYARVESKREIRMTPATGWLVERAVRAYAARPTRERIIELLCGQKTCPRRGECMICMGKANVIMRLYEEPSLTSP